MWNAIKTIYIGNFKRSEVVIVIYNKDEQAYNKGSRLNVYKTRIEAWFYLHKKVKNEVPNPKKQRQNRVQKNFTSFRKARREERYNRCFLYFYILFFLICVLVLEKKTKTLNWKSLEFDITIK